MGIESHTVGHALVLHTREQISAEARSVALAVDPDPANDIVILDLQNEMPYDIWDSVAGALRRRRRRGIRLVVCGARPETGALAGQWLSDRLGRPVTAPFGQIIPGAAGLLFVHADDAGGWIRFRGDQAPVWQSKRYPVPSWDEAAVRYLPISSPSAVEPLPGGVWLRERRDEAAIAGYWHWLTATMPCRPDSMSVVLGCPGTDPLSLDDVARFWRGLGFQGREQARFVQYGPVDLPENETLGQALAALLKSPVTVHPGVPTGRPADPDVVTVGSDGRPGFPVFARELAYHPRRSPASAALLPRIQDHRAPDVLGEPIGVRTHQYTPDAVVEVIQSGLWLRGAEIPRYADRIRARPPNPDRLELIVDDSAPALVDRFRELAGDLADRLDEASRAHVAMQLSSAAVRTGLRAPGAAGGVENTAYRYSAADRDLLAEPMVAEPAVAWADFTVDAPVAAPVAQPVAAPAWATGPTTALPVVAKPSWAVGPTDALPVHQPAAEARVHFQETPADAAMGLRPGVDLDEERAWLRHAFSHEWDTVSAAVARLLGEHAPERYDADILAYAVAVHLYLSAAGEDVDKSLRTGWMGGHVPFARCVAAGLGRLPAYRGAGYASAELTTAELRQIRQRRVLTDWAFTNTLTEPSPGLPGNCEVLIWSLTARRTRVLEPAGGAGVPARAVFLPGTAFKVLHAQEPADGVRGRLLLRELADDEPASGTAVPLDNLAFAALRRCIERDTGLDRGAPVPAAAAGRFVGVPGLI